MSSIPDPVTTNWVPLQGSAAERVQYWGQYSATKTYNDGDCAIGTDGILYMCTVNGTIGSAPVAWPGASAPQGPPGPAGPVGTGIPMPVVNGQWIKGVGGAAVWTPLAPSEVVGAGLVTADADWHYVGAAGEVPFLNGWSNLDGVGPGSRQVRYRKQGSGLVVLTGIPTAGASASAVFTLPVGWRPIRSDSIWMCYASGGLGIVTVNSVGTVTVSNFVVSSGNVTGWIYMNATWIAEA
jgi:hypothetical protein